MTQTQRQTVNSAVYTIREACRARGIQSFPRKIIMEQLTWVYHSGVKEEKGRLEMFADEIVTRVKRELGVEEKT